MEKSNIEKADEGLFAKQDLLPGTVVAFYNGIRVRHKEVRKYNAYEYTVVLF